MATQNCRILVVDDLKDNLLLMRFLLEAEGYAVETAESGEEALKKARSSHPDLMFLDVMMPGMDGFEVAATLNQSDDLKKIPIVFVTAHSNAVMTQSLPDGVHACLGKPIDIDELILSVKSYVRRINTKNKHLPIG
jgi:two-component system, sensor histidine kinase and response regulator